jgi:hypothetical protein
MKRKKLLILILISILCLIASACGPTAAPTEFTPAATNTNTPLPPTPTETSTPLPPMVTTNQQVNCYSGPGENGYELVAAIESGTQMNVVGKDASGKYWIVMDPKSNKGCWVESQFTSAQGETNALPNLVPAPTVVARPNAPGNFAISYKCESDRGVRSVVFHLEWEDKSNNEEGFEIFRNGISIKKVEANITEAVDNLMIVIEVPSTGSINYTILAFNNIGKSTRVEKVIQYHCP